MPIVQLPGGELRDEIRQPQYDTVQLEAASLLAGIRRFFASVTDPAGVPKSLAQTNLEQASQLPTATSFRVEGLCVDASNAVLANNLALNTLMVKSSVALNIGVKNYWKSPLRYACGRLTPVFGTTTADAQSYQQFGWSAVQPVVFRGKHVIDINPLQNFSIVWETLAADLTATEAAFTVAAGSDLWFQASLKGLLRRPVQ